MYMGEMTTLMVSNATKDRLRKYGQIGDTFDTALNRVLDRIEEIIKQDSEKRCSGECPHEAFATT